MSWREFEKLTVTIYKELQPFAHVTHNDHILGVESNTSRQIDVSIRYSIENQDLLTIIQAKDYGQPADINVVGEFASVIKDVKANKGILVCKSGFSSNAKTYAQNLGIEVCNIHDATSRNWAMDIKLPVLWIDLFPKVSWKIQWHVEAGDYMPDDPKKWIFITKDQQGRELDEMLMMDIFVRPWNEGIFPRTVGNDFTIDYKSDTLEMRMKDRNNNLVSREMKLLKLSYKVERTCWHGFFSPEECRGVFDYSDDTFTPSYLPIGSIPMKRDKSWKEIDDPDKLAVTIPGYLVTTENWQLEFQNAVTNIVNRRLIKP